jgi:GTPase SAR1 family protein
MEHNTSGGSSGRNPSMLAFKIVIVGDLNVGKTHIIYQYVNEKLPNEPSTTLGIEFHTKIIRFQLQD